MIGWGQWHVHSCTYEGWMERRSTTYVFSMEVFTRVRQQPQSTGQGREACRSGGITCCITQHKRGFASLWDVGWEPLMNSFVNLLLTKNNKRSAPLMTEWNWNLSETTPLAEGCGHECFQSWRKFKQMKTENLLIPNVIWLFWLIYISPSI